MDRERVALVNETPFQDILRCCCFGAERNFLKDFDSLSSTVKRSAICNALDMSRAPLSSLVGGDNDTDNVRRLLQRMKLESRKIKPRNLGLIGEALISEQFEDLNGVDMDSFRYRKVEITDYCGVPYLIETAFVSRPDCTRNRSQVVGHRRSTSLP